MGQAATDKKSGQDKQLPEGVGIGSGLRNQLLLSIPPSEFRVLGPSLEPCQFRQHENLHEPTQKLQFAYFPNDGLVSLVVTTEDGSTVEAGMVGREGLVGLATIAGLTRCPLRQVVQVSGERFRIRIGALQAVLKSAAQFQSVLCRYAVVMGMQMAQTAACNRLHDAEQRLARWLLMADDRVELVSSLVTHDFLAAILGTDRPSVSLAAKMLQRQGIIEYKRGKIGILSRKSLETVSCECYRVIRSLSQNSLRIREPNTYG